MSAITELTRLRFLQGGEQTKVTALAEQLENLIDQHLVDYEHAPAAFTTPTNHGAVGDGLTDDTAAVAAALGSGGRFVFFPDGDYLITAPGLAVPSNTTIVLSRGARLLANTVGGWGDMAIFNIDAVTNIEILGGGTLDGQKAANPTGRCYGVKIINAASDIRIADITCQNFPSNTPTGQNGGDGVYISGNDVLLDNVRCIGNTRQGVSITKGERITLRRCRLQGTIGNDPGGGLDIEAGNSAHVIADVLVEGCTITENERGVLIWNAVQAPLRNIRLVGNTISNNREHGVYYTQVGLDAAVASPLMALLIAENEIRGNGEDGIHQLTSSRGVRTTSNRITHNGGRGAYLGPSSRGYKFTDNDVLLNGEHGVVVDYAFNGKAFGTITGNVVFNNGTSAANTYDGVHFLGNASHVDFSAIVGMNSFGNHIDFSVTATQRDGVRLSANTSKVQVLYNQDVGLLGVGVTDLGTENIVVAATGAVVDVRAYGAKGDGTTNDTAVIQAAINVASAGGRRGIVYFPPGTYLVSQLVLTGKPVTLRGNAERGTFIKGDGTAHVLYANNGSFVTGIVIEDINVYFGTPQATYDGCNFTKVELFALNRVGFGGCRYGFHGVTDVRLGTITSCIFGSNNQRGVNLGAGCDENAIVGNWFDENLARGLSINGSFNTVVGNRFQDNVNESLFIDTAGADNTVVGNAFKKGTATANGVSIHGDRNNVLGNTFDDHSSHEISLAATADANNIGPNSLPTAGTVNDGGTNTTNLRPVAGVLALNKLGVGNSAAATTPGTVVKKIQVFDAAGASLGYVPVYDAIT